MDNFKYRTILNTFARQELLLALELHKEQTAPLSSKLNGRALNQNQETRLRRLLKERLSPIRFPVPSIDPETHNLTVHVLPGMFPPAGVILYPGGYRLFDPLLDQSLTPEEVASQLRYKQTPDGISVASVYFYTIKKWVTGLELISQTYQEIIQHDQVMP